MSRARLRSSVALLALVACACSATTRGIGTVQAPAPASFIRINGAGHGFEGAAPADLERAYAALMQWFERHLGSAAK